MALLFSRSSECQEHSASVLNADVVRQQAAVRVVRRMRVSLIANVEPLRNAAMTTSIERLARKRSGMRLTALLAVQHSLPTTLQLAATLCRSAKVGRCMMAS